MLTENELLQKIHFTLTDKGIEFLKSKTEPSCRYEFIQIFLQNDVFVMNLYEFNDLFNDILQTKGLWKEMITIIPNGEDGY